MNIVKPLVIKKKLESCPNKIINENEFKKRIKKE